LTSSLVCIWFAGGSVAALIISLFKVNVMVQLVVFVVVSALLLVLLRPVFKRITASKTTRTNADRVIGQNGVVIQDIDPIKGEGQVIVIGQVWSAKPEDGKSVFARDQAVVITGITGVKVLVRAKMPGE
jgi:membrane protein implicated in regulation of membrane protease activity